MNKLTSPFGESGFKKLRTTVYLMFFISILLSLTFFLINRNSSRTIDSNSPKSSLDHSVIRVGYGGFPPYTILDLTTGQKKVTGFSVDLVNEIAKLSDRPLKIEWVNFNWETMKTDLAADKFDFIADPVFQTITRAKDFGMSEPYSYFGIAVGVVNINDNRFTTFKDLDRSDITISLADGWTSTEYAKQNLSKPKFKMISVSGDAYNQLDEVLLGRADVALNDVPTVAQYVKAHEGKVKALFLKTPPSTVPGGFLTKKGDQELINFLNTAIHILQANGTLKKLDEKWKTYGYLPEINFSIGSGF